MPKRDPKVGDDVYFHGDMANQAFTGEVVELDGSQMLVSVVKDCIGEPTPEPRETWWVFQSTVHGPRWDFLDEYQAKRKVAIEQMAADMRQILARRSAL